MNLRNNKDSFLKTSNLLSKNENQKHKRNNSFLMLVLASFSSSKLLANTSVYINQAPSSGGEINLNRNEDLIFPTAVTGYAPANIENLICTSGITWQYEYESAINGSAYRFTFPNAAGYYTITFQFYGRGGSWNTVPYNIFIAP